MVVTYTHAAQRPVPDCFNSTRGICNALVVTVDKLVDQGRYCNCPLCNEDATTGGSAFLWQDHIYPGVRFRYVLCSNVLGRNTCTGREASAAALTVSSPLSDWRPQLESFTCACPTTAGADEPLYYLTGWSVVDGNRWVYRYVCERSVCQPGRGHCALEYDVGAGRRAVDKICECQPTHFCDLKSELSDEDIDWSVDQTTGTRFFRRHCVKYENKTPEKKDDDTPTQG